MSAFKVTLTIGDTTDSTEIEAESRDVALLLSGATLGAAMIAESHTASLTYQLLGVGAIQEVVEEALREEISELLVEEL